MYTHLKSALILVAVLSLVVPLYAQNSPGMVTPEPVPQNNVQIAPPEKTLTETTALPEPKEKNTSLFLDFINKKAYADTVDEKEEKKILREKWKELLNIDIFYPYFKAKEVEDWVSDKTKVNFFNFKGRAKFENNQFKYTFKVKF